MFTVELHAGMRRAAMVERPIRREAAKRFGVHRNMISKMLHFRFRRAAGGASGPRRRSSAPAWRGSTKSCQNQNAHLECYTIRTSTEAIDTYRAERRRKRWFFRAQGRGTRSRKLFPHDSGSNSAHTPTTRSPWSPMPAALACPAFLLALGIAACAAPPQALSPAIDPYASLASDSAASDRRIAVRRRKAD